MNNYIGQNELSQVESIRHFDNKPVVVNEKNWPFRACVDRVLIFCWTLRCCRAMFSIFMRRNQWKWTGTEHRRIRTLKSQLISTWKLNFCPPKWRLHNRTTENWNIIARNEIPNSKSVKVICVVGWRIENWSLKILGHSHDDTINKIQNENTMRSMWVH